MGFFSGLDAEKYDRQYSDRELVRRILKYFDDYYKKILWIAFWLLIIAGTGALLPILVSRSLDRLAANISVQNLAVLALLVLFFGVLQWVANLIRRRLIVRVVGDVELDLRVDAFTATNNHDMSFFDEMSSGRIVSRITSDTREFGQLIVLLTDLISQIIQAVVLAVILFFTQVRLTLILLAMLPIIFAVALGFRRIARVVTRRGMRAMANVNAAIKETISGISIAKNFRQEPAIYDEFDDANITSYQVNVRRGFILSMIFPVLRGLEGIGVAILTYFGGLIVIAGTVTIGNWYLFILSLERFFFPILNLSAFWAQVQSGLSAAERIFALIDAEPRVVQTDQVEFDHIHGDIKFIDLDFQYTQQEIVLKNFDLEIYPKESVALVGHTGAGKSSIAKLVSRFYEFQDGKLLIDDTDIRRLDLTCYRKNLGIVPQTPFLFSGSVYENIVYSHPEVTKDEVLSLSMQIGEGDWLTALPNGLDTPVGERGSQLSIGQRQLVSLLRVIVGKPAIFILDEATASIDPFTEWQIQQALNYILRQSTSILIAHRLSTVKAADRIIVLENGKIIEQGDHDQLMSNNGHYSNLYNTYFRHQSLEYIQESKSRFTPARST